MAAQLRPSQLDAVFADTAALPGVAERTAKQLQRLTGGRRVLDLLWHLPTGLIDRRHQPSVADAPDGEISTLLVTVNAHFPGHGHRQPHRIHCSDETGQLHIVYFHGRRDWLERLFPTGQQKLVSGRIEDFQGQRQLVHPDIVANPEERARVATIEPVYPLTEGLNAKLLRKAITAALSRAPDLPEWQDPAFLRQQGWPAWRAALAAAHQPQANADLDPAAPARARLAYDELLANQLTLQLTRQRQRRQAGRALTGDGRLARAVRAALPFPLTGDQESALAAIQSDMAASARMLRLLQGDVGSGKTIVALLAMLTAVEAGTQAALMAPTEILARQHYATLQPLLAEAGLSAVLLTGKDKAATRRANLAALASGETAIAVGTHALFQKEVAFADLGLAVIDEQHRFGVSQRVELTAKGRRPDILVMTATPIPRTLSLTLYGDMDVSRIVEKPPGRQPVRTVLKPMTRLDDVIAAVRRAMAAGRKVFWVCPLVEESEQSDLAAATERHAALRAALGERVGLVHGRMGQEAKEAVMAAFAGTSAQDRVDVLVATTVIEVGVDVPEATVMVIEHADRFGLAQLHQLRGRVGRGREAATCILLHGGELAEPQKRRLRILRESDDGFRIAEEDMALRGAGDVLGTRQAGLPAWRVADPDAHSHLFEAATDDAKLVLARDPELESARGQALRTLLYLFERDEAVRYLRSG